MLDVLVCNHLGIVLGAHRVHSPPALTRPPKLLNPSSIQSSAAPLTIRHRTHTPFESNRTPPRTGLKTLEHFQAKRYHWAGLGLSKQPTLLAKAKRAAQQLLPHRVDAFDWQATAGARGIRRCRNLPAV